METKLCKKCGRELPTTDFNKCASNKDGLQSYCRECQHEIQKDRTTCLRKIKNDNPLSRYTPRELMLELKARGYDGTITYVQKIKLADLC